MLDKKLSLLNYLSTAKDNSPAKKKQKHSLVSLLVNASQSLRSSDETQAQLDEPPSLESRVKRELDFYPNLRAPAGDEDVLSWWRCINKSCRYCLRSHYMFFTSCATSVPSERLFSLSEMVVTKRRNVLKPSLVDKLVFLAFNLRK